MIRFTTISATERVPGVYTELVRAAAQGLPTGAARLVLIGQKLSAGTISAATPTQITSVSHARDLCGRGSMLARMVEAALTTQPQLAELWVVALLDAGGGAAQAAGSIAVAISSLTAGTLYLRLAGQTLRLAIASGDTANDIAAAIKAAIDEAPDLPLTATVSTNTVTTTARHKGTLGNKLDMGYEFSGTGLTLTVTAMSGGSGDPTVQTALDALFPETWDVIVTPYADSSPMDDVVDHLDAVSDGTEQRPGVAVAALDDTLSNATTLAGNLNHARVVLAWLEATESWPPEVAAAYGALLAGEPDLALPLNTLALPMLHVPVVASRPLRSELAVALANGVAPLVVEQNEVRVLRAISTYLTDSGGSADSTFLDIQTVRVADYVRRSVRERLSTRFARAKIAAVAHTETTTDPDAIRAEVIDVLQRLERIDYVEAVEDNLAGVLVERNEGDPTRVDIRVPADVVNGLHILAARIDVSL